MQLTHLALRQTQRLQEVARIVAEAVIGGHPEMMDLIEQLMDAMNINVLPSLGIARPGHLTKRHQHFSGVFNLLLQQGGTKVWYPWPPWANNKSKTSRDMLTVEQRAGDVMWPPGWWHEVLTSGGKLQKTVKEPLETVCLHSVCWVMPVPGRSMWRIRMPRIPCTQINERNKR